MKNNIKKLLLRAAQTAVISAVVLPIVNWLYLNIQYNPAKMDIAPDMIWVLQGVLIATASSVLYSITWASKKFGLTDYNIYWEILMAVVLGLAYCMIRRYTPVSVDNMLFLSGPVLTLVMAIFWPEAGRSVLVAIFFTGVLCIFEYMKSYGDISNFTFWLWPAMPLMLGVVTVGRSIRWLFKTLFFTDHFKDKNPGGFEI